MTDFIDHCIDMVAHAAPFNELLDSIEYMNTTDASMEFVKMNLYTHRAITEQLCLEFDITEVNGLPVIVDDTLPNHVYKFD